MSLARQDGRRHQTLRRKTEVRQPELIQAARRIVASSGMDGLTIEALARSVGITSGAIFRHFRDKRAILLGLVEDIDASLISVRLEAAARSRAPLENLKELVREHLSSAERRRGVSFVVMAEVLRSRDSALRTKTRDVLNRHLAEIERLLIEAAKAKEIRQGDTKAQAIALFGLVQGTVTLWKIGWRNAPPGAHFDALWHQYAYGIASDARTNVRGVRFHAGQ